MQYLYYILNKLNLTGNSIRLSFIKKISNSEITGKIKTKIGISNKDIKTQFTIYIIFIFTFLLIPCLWYLFFPITLADVIPNIFNIEMPNIMITLIVFIVIAILNTGYIFLRRYLLFKTKEPKPKNINLYNRELPDNLTPAHARLLVYDGTIDSKTLACTILDLVDRGYLKLELGNKSEIFTKELLISKTNKSQNDLFEYEQFLINWFFDKEKINTFDLHKKLIDINTNPYEYFSIFQGLVLLSFPFDKYYKKHNIKNNYIMHYAKIFCIFLIIFSLNIIIKNIFVFGISEFLILFSISKMLFIPPSYILNDTGAETRDSYLDLKQFLIDFSSIQNKSSENIILWNYYLSYSIALGIDGIANKEISDFFGNEIYNLNNQNISNKQYMDELINNTDNVIETSNTLYKNRK